MYIYLWPQIENNLWEEMSISGFKLIYANICQYVATDLN